MEPIAAQTSPIAVRPYATGAATSDLAALLRSGRVVAGEVLQSLAGGGVMIGIGRHRVPAQTHLELEPGQHFLFQVHESAGEVTLRILGGGGGGGSDYLRFLREVIGANRPIGELLGELAARVRAELSAPGGDSDGAERLGRLLAAIEDHVARPGQSGEALRLLLLRGGLFYEAALAALGGPRAEPLEELRRDLKAQLLAALSELDAGPVKEAVARALASIEAEQLLNLARAQAGESQVMSFPLPDAHGWTTAQLFVPPRREEGADPEASRRFVLGVTFSLTGPVRIDVVLSPEALTARVLVTRPELERRLARELSGLVQRLGDGRRAVRVVAALGTVEEVRVGACPADVRFLQDHRVMDLSA